ncbi:MAG TPA: helix-turn-helix domain-containing protein [Candidatus Paceibacterota bacterium]|nr:helix-turn-helix domain-containing protein [Candidatus Paceibacterota bacterium]
MTANDIHGMRFEEFLSELMKDRGLTVKKLSAASGISAKHLESLLSGNFAALPSAPYVRGYFVKLGGMLGFDPEPWWTKIKTSGFLNDSSAHDAPTKNRFSKKDFSRIVWILGIAALVLVYFLFQFRHIFGTPQITLTSPSGNPAYVTTNTVTVAGTLANGTELTLNGETVSLGANGGWSKSVLLAPGMNTVIITAKKFLGRDASLLEQIIYEPASAISAPSSTPTSP